MIDQATQQHPDMRLVTAGHAVKALVLNGLGLVNPQLSLVPHLYQNTPTSQLIAPAMAPEPRNDEALGRALDPLSADGVTERYRLMAATAAEHLGLAPTFAHRDCTSFQGDGRDNSDEAPAAQVIHLTRG